MFRTVIAVFNKPKTGKFEFSKEQSKKVQTELAF